MEKMTLGFRSGWHWTFIGVLLTWGLVVNCWGGWETCYSKSLKHTFALTGKKFGLLQIVPCPPGVTGTCFGAGPKMKAFNDGLLSRTECENKPLIQDHCDDSPGEIIICTLAYEPYGPVNHRYIHSSNPPSIVYIKWRYAQGPPPPDPQRTSQPTFQPTPQPQLNTVPSQAEKDALILKLSNLYVTRWKKQWGIMTHGASGYAIFPSGMKTKINYVGGCKPLRTEAIFI